jgi:hypothetical protein
MTIRSDMAARAAASAINADWCPARKLNAMPVFRAYLKPMTPGHKSKASPAAFEAARMAQIFVSLSIASPEGSIISHILRMDQILSILLCIYNRPAQRRALSVYNCDLSVK